MTDFSRTRDLFHLPDGVIYLDGNSLGPLPKTALARATRTMADEWGEMLIGGWNKAQWMAMPGQIGNRIAIHCAILRVGDLAFARVEFAVERELLNCRAASRHGVGNPLR